MTLAAVDNMEMFGNFYLPQSEERELQHGRERTKFVH
jgi:hypothetical protein